MKALLYYILNYTFPKLEKDVIKIIKNEKKLVIFDVGCYRGFFTKTILKSIKKKKYKFYLFDINKNVKQYIADLLKLKNIYYHEVAISNRNGKAKSAGINVNLRYYGFALAVQLPTFGGGLSTLKKESWLHGLFSN